MAKKLQHINRALTAEERKLASTIREAAKHDFPPMLSPEKPIPGGIPRQIFDARKRRGLTRYELGKSANVPSTAVRDIEQGDDVPLSQFHAVVRALRLTIEIVDKT